MAPATEGKADVEASSSPVALRSLRDIPVIFSGAMVRALLDGRKTMTRRLAYRQKLRVKGGQEGGLMLSPWARVAPGDRLWVRENWRALNRFNDYPVAPNSIVRWEADIDESCLVKNGGRLGKLRPSIHMPRWASRITLTVTAAKIEPLNSIDGLDALAEGVQREEGTAPWRMFRRLWISLHGEDSWKANPQVVAVTFVVNPANIDSAKPLPVAASTPQSSTSPAPTMGE